MCRTKLAYYRCKRIGLTERRAMRWSRAWKHRSVLIFAPLFIKEKWIDLSAVKSRGKVVLWPFIFCVLLNWPLTSTRTLALSVMRDKPVFTKRFLAASGQPKTTALNR